MNTNTILTEKYRIFFIIPSLQDGGAERVIIALANHFNRLNFKSVIVVLNKGVPAYMIDKGVKVIYLLQRKSDSLPYRCLYMVQTFCKLSYLLLKERPVCALSFITSSNLWTGLTCSLTGIPYIVSERTSPNRSIGRFNQLSKKIAALIYKRSTAVVVGAKGVEDCLRENKGFKDLTNIKRIINAVPAFNARSGNSVHHRKFILGVGRLSYVKGFDQLIKAFANIEHDDIDMVIVGGGEEKDNLIALIDKLGLTDRVKLPGHQTNLQDYYSQAELFVLPSRNEGYPNALVEAMSMGCACIAMDCQFGPSEIIKNNENGILVKACDIPALTESINVLLTDEELRDSLSVQAIEIAKTNDPELILQKWEDLILGHVSKEYPLTPVMQ